MKDLEGRNLETKYYQLFLIVFVTCLLVSNIMAQKIGIIFGQFFTTAIIVFPITYIIGDILTEVYGYRLARRAIWYGFLASALMVILLEISISIDPAPFWSNQKEYETTLRQVPRVVVASLIAYLCGEFANSYVLSRMKVLTEGKHLWSRTIGSTVVGQFIDTAIFAVVAFYGVMPTPQLIAVAASAYVFKVIYEIAATPLTYLAISWVKRIEGIDVIDRQINYTPFKFD